MKSKRQEKILELIAQYAIETQEELLERLSECGIPSTQATVSRDIKEMMLIKVPDEDGRYKYSFPSDDSKIFTMERLEDTLRGYTLTISSAENLIVLHTLPGTAQAVAYALDHLNWKELLGTVGGDDTVLLIVDSKDHVETVKNRLMAKKGR